MVKIKFEEEKKLRRIFSKEFLIQAQILILESTLKNCDNLDELLEIIVEFDVDVFRIELYFGCGSDCDSITQDLEGIKLSEVIENIY